MLFKCQTSIAGLLMSPDGFDVEVVFDESFNPKYTWQGGARPETVSIG